MHKTLRTAFLSLFACVLAVTCVLSISACGRDDKAEIQKVITSQLDVLKAPNADTVKSLLALNTDEESQKSMQELKDMGMDPSDLVQKMYAKFDYKIDDITVNGDDATVDLTIKNIDFASVFKDAITKAFSDPSLWTAGSEDEVQKLFVQNLTDQLDKKLSEASDLVESKVSVDVHKKDGAWQFGETELSHVLNSMLEQQTQNLEQDESSLESEMALSPAA